MDLLIAGLFDEVFKTDSHPSVVAGGGLEPSTRGFSVHCYYQLSYPAILSEHRAPLHDRTHPQQESLFQFLCLYLSISDFLLQGTNLFCKMLDLNQLPIVYQTIALPYELISLQKLIAVRAFIYNKQKRKENHYDSWLRGVGLEPTISSL